MANLGLQNNNPGNIKDPATGNFRVFNTPEEGYNALLQDIKIKQSGQSQHIKPGASIQELANVWAPASDNNVPANWANNVSKAIGIPTAYAFDKVPAEQLAKGIQAAEGTSTMPIQNTNKSSAAPSGVSSFAQKIKAKYPQYQNMSDEELTQKVLAKYPQYKDMVGEGVSSAQPSAAPKEEGEGIIPSIFRSITSPVATMLARPIQAGAMLAGVPEQTINEVSARVPFYGDKGALNVPTSGQDLMKDVGRGMETISLGLPVKGISGAMKVGALAGAGAGLEQEGTLGGAAKGGLVGTSFGLAGGLMSKALAKMPSWILGKTDFSKLAPDELQKALNTKTIGTKSSLLVQSQKAVQQHIDEIEKVLLPVNDKGAGNFAFRATQQQFPEYAGQKGTEKMISKISSLIRSGGSSLDDMNWNRGNIISTLHKIADGTATLTEKNQVASAINTSITGGYEKLARALNPSAGHDLAMSFVSALRSEIKNVAPKTQPIFEELAKEMAFKKIIKKLVTKSSGGLLRFRDIIPFMAGSGLAGPFGGFGGVLLDRAMESPSMQFGAAKTLQGAGKLISPMTSRAGLISIPANK